MKWLFLAVCLTSCLALSAQELYPYAEPASNMPAHTLTPKLRTVFAESPEGRLLQRYAPELMWGISKRWMVHAGTSFSNMAFSAVQLEGAYFYGKFRFYSNDAVHAHFRMAAFAEAGWSRSPQMYTELSVQGENNGFQLGLIATQLKNKLALSATTSVLKVFQRTEDLQHLPLPDRAFSYSLSAGYLILPVEYESYDQLNLNVYAELLGQSAFGGRSYFLDAAPSVQLIFNSNSKLNLGYRFQLTGNGFRSANSSFQLSFEHTFFNVFPKRGGRQP